MRERDLLTAIVYQAIKDACHCPQEAEGRQARGWLMSDRVFYTDYGYSFRWICSIIGASETGIRRMRDYILEAQKKGGYRKTFHTLPDFTN